MLTQTMTTETTTLAATCKGEKAYPIYQFWVRFSDPGHDVVASSMCKKYLRRDEAFQELQEFIDENLDAERTGKDGQYTIRGLALETVEAGWKFLREATWCCGWFQHYTYSIHLTDDELLESFEQYVRAHEHKDYQDDEYVCLMGAEDRWRWKDPCRCEHCQERSIVMIDH